MSENHRKRRYSDHAPRSNRWGASSRESQSQSRVHRHDQDKRRHTYEGSDRRESRGRNYQSEHPPRGNYERKRGRWSNANTPRSAGTGRQRGSLVPAPKPSIVVDVSPVPQELPNEVLKTIFSTKKVTSRDGQTHRLTANVHIEEGHLLASLIRANGLRRCLEVGCAYGISALFMCQALKESVESTSSRDGKGAENSEGAIVGSDAQNNVDTGSTVGKSSESAPNAKSVDETGLTKGENVRLGKTTVSNETLPTTSCASSKEQTDNDRIQASDDDNVAFLISIDPNQNRKWKEVGLFSVESAGLKQFHRFYEGKSYDIMPKLLSDHAESLDLVFIDGWHTFDYTLVDGFYADLLVKSGGYIVFDDALHKGPQKVVRMMKMYLDRNN